MTVWDQLAGNRTIEALQRQVTVPDPAHSWLLLGPRGAGKTAAATAMAAAMNCAAAPFAGCGECSSCLRILRRRHPDVHHISAEGAFILVDQIRDSVLSVASRSPFEGKKKVFVIEEADRMNPSAQNALLKTLEEPFADTVFILLSGREEELLDTIKSRCRVVHLQRVAEEQIAEMLTASGTPVEKAFLAARVCEGDLQRALNLVASETMWDRRLTWLSIPRRLLSAVDALDIAAEIIAEAREAAKEREGEQKVAIAELAEAMGEGRGTATVRTALAKRHKRELRRTEEAVLTEALDALGSFYRDALALRAGGEAVANLDRLEELRSWADSSISDGGFVGAVEACVAARSALFKNANVALTIENALLVLARLVPADPRVTTSH